MARRNRPYSLLARFYDQIVPGIPEMNRHAREKVLRREWPRIGRVLELACGNGATAVDLARKGLDVEAIDLSPTFVRAARRRAAAARAKLRVRRGDMRDFRVERRVDLVLCEFAALNNLAERRDLARVLRCAARALEPGGLFLFDINTPRSFQTQMPALMPFKGRGFELLMRGSADADGLRARLDFDWSLPDRRGRRRARRRKRETIWHVAWTVAELRRALRAAGFTAVEVFDGVDVRPRMKGAVRGTDLYFFARLASRGPARRPTGGTAATARASRRSR